MEATYFLHNGFYLNAKPLLVNHRDASRQINHISFHQIGVSLHVKLAAANSTCRPFVAGCLAAPGRKDGDDMAPRRQLLRRSSSLNTLKRGKIALEGFLDKVAPDKKSLENAEHEFRELLMQEKVHPRHLQEVAWNLEMSGKEDEAVKMLQEKFRLELLKNIGEEAYELGLLLVEMLIYQGEFREAEVMCRIMAQKEMSDARPPLYLAVTYLMMGDTEKSKAKWEEFNDSPSIPINFDEGLQKTELTKKVVDSVPNNFDEETELTFEDFKKVVENLKQEIEKARRA